MLIFDGPQLNICGSTERRWLPRWLYAEDEKLAAARPVRRFASLFECVRATKASRICLHRTYAMGDIIMLFPVARALARYLELPRPILIVTGSRHLRQLGGPFEHGGIKVVQSRGITDYGCDVHMDLDHALEIDHRDPAAGAMDRLAIYAEAIGCRL